ncbi:tumor necrosis factor ligand superfamily member 6 [Hippocampus comes]|uniref:tumor necrosis factor ligand superfamily member 6 n=1 Tax=Hippocampus comes TaxID=109280 RepID=UPI00094F1339|nr:PREDICTED: tumor necrosis factor ligand superfamily member 6 [Hippocampus comes]
MSCDQSYPFQQVFYVDGAQHPGQLPNWSRRGQKVARSGGCTGVIPTLATVVLLLFLLVFAALGFGGYLMYNMQMELRDVRKMSRELKRAQEFSRAEKQIGLGDDGGEKVDKNERMEERTAAHVIGRIEKHIFHKTLRWESRVGAAFTGGGAVYQLEDGALRVNQSGLYHIYSRVELLFKQCSPTSSFIHTVFVRSTSGVDTALMEAHRAGFCSWRSKLKEHHAWTADSYLASAFRLRQNDRILVNVSQPQYLSHSNHGNFFGLYKI